MRRRQETFQETVYRYRGVILVVSIPLLLIAAIIALVPTQAPMDSDISVADPLERIEKDLAKKPVQTSNAVSEKYAVIIDAGSTGSRIHVYKFDRNMELQDINGDLELFVAIKPGLSSYKDDPKKAADSLRGLLGKALEVVPETLRMSTPIRVGATAGLRLLPGDAADNILEEVRNMLNEFPFLFSRDSVKILDGADEGSFAWVTVNYLLNNLGKGVADTVGVVDLGGGSVQMTYAVAEDVAKSAPDGYVHRIKAMGSLYNVYVHSYLGYGLMAGRAEVLKALGDGGGEEGHACVQKGYDATYKYGSDEFPAKSRPTGSAFSDCAPLVSKALDPSSSCSFSACSFGGVWSGGGGAGQAKLYVASYFVDRAGQLGVIPDPKAPHSDVKPSDFATVADKVCAVPLAELQTTFPLVDERDAPFACLDITYQHTLLTTGFGVKPDSVITLVKRIPYKGKEVEAAWPLGAAINALDS